MFLRKKRGQATVEYLLLVAVIVFIAGGVINHARDIFYGWDDQYGAVERFIMIQVKDKLSIMKGGWF